MSKYEIFAKIFFRTEETYYRNIEEDIFVLVYRGDYGAICSKIKKGMSVNLRNDKDQTLLHYAVLYNQVKIAKLLISYGADLEAKDKLGQTVKDIIIQKHNTELYSQLNEYTGDFLQTQTKQELIESQVLGFSEDYNCCILF